MSSNGGQAPARSSTAKAVLRFVTQRREEAKQSGPAHREEPRWIPGRNVETVLSLALANLTAHRIREIQSFYASSWTRITQGPASSSSSQNETGVPQSVTIMSILLKGQVRKLETQFILV